MIYFYSTEQTQANSSYYRGMLFEDMLRKYLRASGYEITLERRKIASLEYDLSGRHTVDNRLIVGEAKAHTESIAGKEVSAFVGKALPFLLQKPPQSAVFLSVSSLTPEAEDYLRNLGETTDLKVTVKCGAELEAHLRLVLKLPTPEQALFVTRATVPVPSGQSIIHTDRGTFIAVVGAGGVGAFDDRFALLSEQSITISDEEILKRLRAALPALQELEPVWDPSVAPGSPGHIPRREIPSGLITAMDWLDYRRPSGVSYFIGRLAEIQRVDSMLTNSDNGLIVEVKARSGVGKSSLLSVLAEKWEGQGHRVELHDARDVQSSEDVLRLAQRFIGDSYRLSSFESIGPALNCLKVRLAGRSAVLLVDQFESTFQSPEVYTAYEYLALCIAKCDWSVLMIYSRKDDLLTTHDDLVVSFERLRGMSQSVSLEDFSQGEASALLEKAASAKAHRLSPKVLAQVLEFAQGFPWLLKRTLAHVINVNASGVSQTEMLSRGLHLSDLFEEELAELDEQERGYLSRVAAVLPSTYQALARRFDDDPFLRPMLEKLIHRKLLRFSAGTYDTYNDVFKDFLLYERMPEQGHSELLRVGLVSVMNAFRAIGGAKKIDPQELANVFDKSLTGTYNLLRDMRLAGLVSKTASGWEISDVVRQYEHQGRLGEFVRQSVLKNRIVTAFVVKLEKDGAIPRQEAARWLKSRFPFIAVKDDVWHQYASTLADWMVRLNLAELSEESIGPWRSSAETARDLGNLAVSGRGGRPKKSVFVPSTAWITLRTTWGLIAGGRGNGNGLRRSENSARNDLRRLGAVVEDAGMTFRLQEDFEHFEKRIGELLCSEPYLTFWHRVNRGAGYHTAAAGLLGLDSLSPDTRLSLCKKLANWGRNFGHLPPKLRIPADASIDSTEQADLL